MKISIAKKTYGYLGFLPFFILSITPWIIGGEIGSLFIKFQILYGSVILAFLGGISWGWQDKTNNQIFNVTIGICFSILSSILIFLAISENILLSLILTIIFFYLFYLFESRTEVFKNSDDIYKDFRSKLTLLVCISFLLSSAYWINPYT